MLWPPPNTEVVAGAVEEWNSGKLAVMLAKGDLSIVREKSRAKDQLGWKVDDVARNLVLSIVGIG